MTTSTDRPSDWAVARAYWEVVMNGTGGLQGPYLIGRIELRARELDASSEAYAKANPLGGPATMFETIARRLRAGENYDEVLADYGLARAAEAGDAIKSVLDWQPLTHLNKGDRLYQILAAAGLPFEDQVDSLRAAMGAVGAGDAESAFKAWYWEHGADWNSASIKPVWMAAWSAATSAVGTTRSGTEETEG